MPLVRLAFAALSLLFLAACAGNPPPGTATPLAATAETRQPITILISIDGFRPDYLERGVSPRLSALAARGVSAAMRPSFPSKTFPNHWTLVTGLVPDHHGIVSNSMENASYKKQKFTMSTEEPYWWGTVDPLWVEAEKAGVRSAAMFWPGSSVNVGGKVDKVYGFDAFVGGTRPSDWQEYSRYVSAPQRVQTLLDWMRRPAAIRPRFITLYFDTVDSAGHGEGPDSAAVDHEVAEVDKAIGMLVEGLAELGQPTNFVIVADHGMTAISQDRIVKAESLADPADYRLFEEGPFASFFPVAGHERALESRLLRPHDHVQCWRKGEIPARFRYGSNPRIPPYFCLADIGWMIASKPFDEKGMHGYDQSALDMAALFIANGPAIAAVGKLPTFDNVDIAPLLRDLIGLPAVPGDGSDAPFRNVLRR